MTDTTFEYRSLERDGYCRDCDGRIKRGDMVVSGYSYRNRGMSMHFHPECLKKMFELIPNEPKEN